MGNSNSVMEVDGGIGKRINFWRPFGVGWMGTHEGCIMPGMFGNGIGSSVWGPVMVLGLRELQVIRVLFFGGVFHWRDYHKLCQKRVGKGNAVIVSEVNKGREERGISFLYSGKMREGGNRE